MSDITAKSQTNIIASVIHLVRNQWGLLVVAVTSHHNIVLLVQNHGNQNDDGPVTSAKALK